MGAQHQRGGGIGQPHTAAMPLEQRLPGFGFELGELLRHRGGGDVERFGGGDDRAVRGNGMQSPEAVKVQHARDSKLISQELITCPYQSPGPK